MPIIDSMLRFLSGPTKVYTEVDNVIDLTSNSLEITDFKAVLNNVDNIVSIGARYEVTNNIAANLILSAGKIAEYLAPAIYSSAAVYCSGASTGAVSAMIYPASDSNPRISIKTTEVILKGASIYLTATYPIEPIGGNRLKRIFSRIRKVVRI